MDVFMKADKGSPMGSICGKAADGVWQSPLLLRKTTLPNEKDAERWANALDFSEKIQYTVR